MLSCLSISGLFLCMPANPPLVNYPYWTWTYSKHHSLEISTCWMVIHMFFVVLLFVHLYMDIFKNQITSILLSLAPKPTNFPCFSPQKKHGKCGAFDLLYLVVSGKAKSKYSNQPSALETRKSARSWIEKISRKRTKLKLSNKSNNQGGGTLFNWKQHSKHVNFILCI